MRNEYINSVSVKIILMIFVFVIGCLPLADCSNDILIEAVSPNGKYVATLFERNCGPTTSYVRIISIRKNKEVFDGDKDASYVFIMSKRHDIKIYWQDSEDLIISRPAISDYIFKELKEWDGIQIAYITP